MMEESLDSGINKKERGVAFFRIPVHLFCMD